jgi:hypothetical protein
MKQCSRSARKSSNHGFVACIYDWRTEFLVLLTPRAKRELKGLIKIAQKSYHTCIISMVVRNTVSGVNDRTVEKSAEDVFDSNGGD